MGITYNGSLVADFRTTDVSLQRALGHYVLQCNLQSSTVARADRRYWANDLQANISIQSTEGLKLLGRAEPSGPLMLISGQYPSVQTISFELPLFTQQLAVLEDLRAGGDLTFSLRLLAMVGTDKMEPTISSETVMQTVSQSDWIRLLNQAGYSNTLLLEIPYIATDSPQIAALLTRARNQFDRADYRAAVAQCRSVLEVISSLGNNKDLQRAAKEQYCKSQKGMDANARLHLMREAVTNYTHPANHGDPGALDCEYSRRDALLLLTMTSAIAAHL